MSEIDKIMPTSKGNKTRSMVAAETVTPVRAICDIHSRLVEDRSSIPDSAHQGR